MAALGIDPPAGAEGVEYLLGRDGALTALLGDGAWHGGCSLPRRAAEAMLKAFKPTGPVALFLAPPSAHAIAVVLEKLAGSQAVIALLPEAADLAVFLHCHDFADAVRAHRIYFVSGAGWEGQLAALLTRSPGLPTPTYLIKIPATDEVATPLIAPAQEVIEQACARRERLLGELRRSGAAGDRGTSGFCLLAPQAFQLWSAPGRTLAGLFPGQAVFDADDPATSSPLALATAAKGSRAVVSANVARADLPATVPDDLPWVTWVTTPRVPKFTPAAAGDGLVLADPAWRELALRCGWPQDRLAIGTWPSPSPSLRRPASPATVAILADTTIIADGPATDYSSHRLLWEAIRDELAENPLLAYQDVHAYLSSRMARLSIRPDGFDHAAFLTRLIIPAYEQSLARLVLRAKVPLKLYGRGWDRVDDDLRRHAAGAVSTEGEFAAALSGVSLLVHPYPSPHLHPADFAGVPNHRPAATSPNGYLQQLRAALTNPPPRRADVPPIGAERVEAMLPR